MPSEVAPAQGSAAGLSPEAVVAALRRVLRTPDRPIPLHEPVFAGREWEYVKEALDTGWVSSAGAHVGRFERMVAEAVGARHAVATVNGTAALHVALILAGVRPGEEVIVPALTFVATANAVAYAGAVPHFADAAEATLGLDPAKLAAHLGRATARRAGALVNRATGRRIAALVPMHTFGQPVDLDPLVALARDLGLPVVEDATESLGSRYKGRPTGALGTLGALSFNGNKIVTTGGGGAVVTDDEELARRAKHLTTTAKLPHRWEYLHDEVGFNYRLPNLNAALGCAQIERLDVFLAAKRRLAERYADAFAGLAGATFFVERPFARSNYWLNTLVLAPEQEGARDDVLAASHAAGYLTRPAWRLMHRLAMYETCPRMDLSTAESLERRIVNLPSSASLAPA